MNLRNGHGQLFAAMLACWVILCAAGGEGPELDLENGTVDGVFIGAGGKEFSKLAEGDGAWTGSWKAFAERGLFVQPAKARNMAGVSMSEKSWPSRKYGIKVYSGAISFGLKPGATLDEALAALRKDFGGNFFYTLEEERGVFNRQFIAHQITGWKADPPFMFELFFDRNKVIEEIRLKSFPGDYYPNMLRQRALGPHPVEKTLRD